MEYDGPGGPVFGVEGRAWTETNATHLRAEGETAVGWWIVTREANSWSVGMGDRGGPRGRRKEFQHPAGNKWWSSSGAEVTCGRSSAATRGGWQGWS